MVLHLHASGILAVLKISYTQRNAIFHLGQVLFALHHVALGNFIHLIRYCFCQIILIRDEIKAGKSDKEIYTKLEDDFGETVLYAPKFDMQTAALWLSPLIVAGAAGGLWAYKKHRQKTNVHIMALNLVRGIPLTPKEKETMLEVLTPPPGGTSSLSWWRRWLQQ
ncbi:Cytochrome c-type biogenesis CcmH-like mitochondrial protein [Capsicum baccatum]|uniref:Cytochrome c-type biogenesis protein n=1 Tax=Capsicum baccatum TaxID=33114 RepID=A0A2G2WPA9_CAPBA|nr:Cytochrome c-type biogenesis CcmH-like mitochondrial protein [Capsicum baccatum]